MERILVVGKDFHLEGVLLVAVDLHLVDVAGLFSLVHEQLVDEEGASAPAGV